ncbi:helix-turn-helix domain-containing protein [Pseudoduganella sp. UC29_71]|uniref:helix-turn-helix domain-containing protein n=1 Tax=Pseudoduganella sp. UC29_71 TaxID=3350174 RepID=UPI00367275AC
MERLFQRVFHYSPRQLLLQTRLNGALALIESGRALSIAEIAADCGYTDHSAFSRQFKALTGQTPVQYRAQCRASSAGPAAASLLATLAPLAN